MDTAEGIVNSIIVKISGVECEPPSEIPLSNDISDWQVESLLGLARARVADAQSAVQSAIAAQSLPDIGEAASEACQFALAADGIAERFRDIEGDTLSDEYDPDLGAAVAEAERCAERAIYLAGLAVLEGYRRMSKTPELQ